MPTMMKPLMRPEFVLIDPWAGSLASAESATADPVAPPLRWSRLSAESRERLGATLIYVAALLPGAGPGDVAVLAARVLQTMRARISADGGSRPARRW